MGVGALYFRSGPRKEEGDLPHPVYKCSSTKWTPPLDYRCSEVFLSGQHNEILGKDLPQQYRMAIAENVENNLYSKVRSAQRAPRDHVIASKGCRPGTATKGFAGGRRCKSEGCEACDRNMSILGRGQSLFIIRPEMIIEMISASSLIDKLQ